MAKHPLDYDSEELETNDSPENQEMEDGEEEIVEEKRSKQKKRKANDEETASSDDAIKIYLKEIQKKLGLIHDSDITMDYLQNSRQGLAKQLVNKETAERNNLYIEFVKYIKE